jgi:hypothetical protein
MNLLFSLKKLVKFLFSAIIEAFNFGDDTLNLEVRKSSSGRRGRLGISGLGVSGAQSRKLL